MTLTKSLEQQIDIVQRQFLGRILNIKWCYKIANEELYTRTNCIRLSQNKKVQQRRIIINWFGHLCRLPENAPAKLAFFESTTYVSTSTLVILF